MPEVLNSTSISLEKSLSLQGVSLINSYDKEKCCGVRIENEKTSEILVVDWNDPSPKIRLLNKSGQLLKENIKFFLPKSDGNNQQYLYLPWPAASSIQPQEETLLCFSADSADKKPPVDQLQKHNKQLFYVPLCGLFPSSDSSLEWKDGWILHMSKQGDLMTAVMPGNPSKVTTTLLPNEAATPALKQLDPLLKGLHPGEIKRQMVVASIRHYLQEKDPRHILIEDQSKQEALLFVLFLQAAKENSYSYNLETENDASLVWKKFTRSLSLQKRPNKLKQDDKNLRLKDLAQLLPKKWEETVSAAINDNSRIFDLKEWL